jgi:hypothetical protein
MGRRYPDRPRTHDAERTLLVSPQRDRHPSTLRRTLLGAIDRSTEPVSFLAQP